MLGRINQMMNNFERAIFHYRESLQIQLSYLSSTDRSLSFIYASIGANLEKLGDHNEGIKFFQNIINNCNRTKKIDQFLLTISHLAIGRIYYKEKNLMKARKNFQLTLEYAQNANIDDKLLREIDYYLKLVS